MVGDPTRRGGASALAPRAVWLGFAVRVFVTLRRSGLSALAADVRVSQPEESDGDKQPWQGLRVWEDDEAENASQ
jgi:hypothetical protein